MERRFTAKSVISIAALISAIVLFMLRSEYCKRVYPYADSNLAKAQGVSIDVHRAEWNGADIFTMNVFAALLFISFTLPFYYKRTIISAALLSFLASLTVTDVIDRFIFHIHEKTKYELIVTIITAIFIILEHYGTRKDPKSV